MNVSYREFNGGDPPPVGLALASFSFAYELSSS